MLRPFSSYPVLFCFLRNNELSEEYLIEAVNIAVAVEIELICDLLGIEICDTEQHTVETHKVCCLILLGRCRAVGLRSAYQLAAGVYAYDDLGQYRIYPDFESGIKKNSRQDSREHRLMFNSCCKDALNQTDRVFLSARYRFANANMIYFLEVCFRRPRYRVLRYPNNFFTERQAADAV